MSADEEDSDKDEILDEEEDWNDAEDDTDDEDVEILDDLTKIACFKCNSSDGDPNSFVVCDFDGCTQCAHLKCAKLRKVPKGNWFCSATCKGAYTDQHKQAAPRTRAPKKN